MNKYLLKVAELSGGETLLEDLSELEHDQWVSWAKSLLKDEPGISRERKERWQKLFVPYENLSEKSKEQDRVFARKVLKILGSYKHTKKSS